MQTQNPWIMRIDCVIGNFYSSIDLPVAFYTIDHDLILNFQYPNFSYLTDHAHVISSTSSLESPRVKSTDLLSGCSHPIVTSSSSMTSLTLMLNIYCPRALGCSVIFLPSFFKVWMNFCWPIFMFTSSFHIRVKSTNNPPNIFHLCHNFFFWHFHETLSYGVHSSDEIHYLLIYVVHLSH